MDDKLTKAQIKEQRHQERQVFETKMKQEASRAKFKKFGMWAFALGILALAVWGMIALVNTPTTTSNSSLTIPKIDQNDITRGPKNVASNATAAKVTLVEYADFQCPACGAYFPMIQKLHTDFDGKVLFVYRYFPLTNIHRNAMSSAQAAQAANVQGKFWEMHDLLFQHQQDWAQLVDPTQTFIGYATTLGLDMDKFKSDMQSDATKKFINAQEDAGVAAGVNSTPSFFINGQQITNPASYDEFKKLIVDQLK